MEDSFNIDEVIFEVCEEVDVSCVASEGCTRPVRRRYAGVVHDVVKASPDLLCNEELYKIEEDYRGVGDLNF